LIYLDNSRPDIFFAMRTLRLYLVESKAVPVGCREEKYNWIWFVSGDEVRLQRYIDSD